MLLCWTKCGGYKTERTKEAEGQKEKKGGEGDKGGFQLLARKMTVELSKEV